MGSDDNENVVTATQPEAKESNNNDELKPQFDKEDEDELLLEQEEIPDEPLQPSDLYLDTISRSMLDFDFEKLCSVSLSNINIYACLSCGKYFQGRGKKSHAYSHSIHDDHHVFINLETLKVYVLPDLYEVNDPSLEDIKYLLAPTFTPELLNKIDNGFVPSRDLQDNVYLPGFIGFNNIKNNSYMNVILQGLLHVLPLRDYFIFNSQMSDPWSASSSSSSASIAIPSTLDKSALNRKGFQNKSQLISRFGLFARKMWNPKLFKPQVSPHEFLQEVVSASGKKFRITESGEPLAFLGWLLHSLHNDLGGNKKDDSSIIYSTFRGEMKIEEQAVLVKDEAGTTNFDLDRDIKTKHTSFLFLTLDLPPTPVFRDTQVENIIPQVSILNLLSKYDGNRTDEFAGTLKRFKLTKLPPFIIFHIKRFSSNKFVEEKNPTIVEYPLRGIDMRDYLENADPNKSYIYDLVSNITHSSTSGTANEDTLWSVHVHTRPERVNDEKWFQIQDLIVEEVQRQKIFLGDSYIQVWGLRGNAKIGVNNKVVTPQERIKTTRSRTAAAEMSKKHEVDQDHLVPGNKKQKLNLGKMRVEKGDSTNFEI